VDEFARAHRAGTRVLIGAPTALAGSPPRPAPARIARRTLTGLDRDPVIRDHRIGAHEVLPATFGLGWLINVAERAHPGLKVLCTRDFQVRKGIVFDEGTAAVPRWVELSDSRVHGDRVVLTASTGADTGRTLPAVHYSATLELGTAPAAAPIRPVTPSGAGARPGAEIYDTAIQFHGPCLQGLREILELTGERLVARCRLTDHRVAGGAFHGALHSPVLADVLLQGPSVLGNHLLGEACLPLAIGAAEYYAPLPGDADYLLVVDDVRRTAQGLTATATALDPAGRTLLRLRDLVYIATPAMSAKFAEAVAHRRNGPATPTPLPGMETAQ
jgi:hypothetical protein